MTVSQVNTFQTICEVRRTQLLTILAMSKLSQLAGFPSTRCFHLFVEGSTAWLHDSNYQFITQIHNTNSNYQ